MRIEKWINFEKSSDNFQTLTQNQIESGGPQLSTNWQSSSTSKKNYFITILHACRYIKSKNKMIYVDDEPDRKKICWWNTGGMGF